MFLVLCDCNFQLDMVWIVSSTSLALSEKSGAQTETIISEKLPTAAYIPMAFIVDEK